MANYNNNIDIYSNGAFQGLSAGLQFLQNRDSIAANERTAKDAMRQRDKEFTVAAHQQQGQFDSTMEYNKLLESNRGQEWQKKFEHFVERAKSEEGRLNELTKADVGLRNSQAAQNNAAAHQTNVATNAGVASRMDMTYARLSSDLTSTILDKYGNDVDKALADPKFVAKLRAAGEVAPELKAALETHHNMTMDGPSIAPVGESDRVAFTGQSTVNGERTLATARNGTVADGADDPATSMSNRELLAYLSARGVAGGDRSDATLSLAASLSEEAGVDVATAGNANAVIPLLKETTADYPTQEGPPEVAVQPGFRGGQMVLGGPPEYAGPLTQQVPAVPVPQGPSKGLRAATAANAMYPGAAGADAVADAAQRGVLGEAENTFRRKEEGLDNQSARTIAEDQAAFDRTNPNADVQANNQRMELVKQGSDFMKGLNSEEKRRGIAAAFAPFNFTKEKGFFDQPAESLLNSTSSDPKVRNDQNLAFGVADLEMTVADVPENQDLISRAIQARFGGELVPYSQWGKQEWQAAGEIMLLSREDDQDDGWFGRDIKTTGELDPKAVERWIAGEKLNTRKGY